MPDAPSFRLRPLSLAVCAGLALAVGCAPPLPGIGSEVPREALDAMTFNVRFDAGLPPDEPDRWARPEDPRREAALDTILRASPDVLGVQEALWNQVQDLEDGLLPRYRWAGHGRDDGDRAGEFAAVFWRNDRYELIADGTFWLSLEPGTAGSVFPGAATTRIATWVQLEERATRRLLLVLNTHWDHVSQDARQEGAALIVQELELLAPSPRGRLVLGDLNADEDNPAFLTLRDAAGLVDTYRAANPVPAADEATFHGFGGDPEGVRTDHVLASAGLFEVTSSRIVRDRGPGGFPSDHFPVVSRLSW